MALSHIGTPQLHPTEDELIALAAGQLDVSRRILLEAHLTYCRVCRELLASFASAGSRLLGATPEEAAPTHLLDGLLARIEVERKAPDPYAELPLPADLRATLPRSENPLVFDSPKRWTNDSKVACLLTDPRAQAQLFLLQVPADGRIPRHEHLGHEHALCLAGACHDEHTRLEAGDYYHYEPGSDHFPIMESGEPCWIVVRVEKGVRYLD